MVLEDSILRRSDVLQLLSQLRSGKVKELRPVLDPLKGFRYPTAEEVIKTGTDDVNYILNTLARLDVLRGEIQESLNACSKCGGASHFFTYRCPSCSSSKLEKGPVLEHLVCGHVDFEQAFVKGGVYQCPKCKKTMTTLGVDYRRPGTYYKCLNCGRISAIPARHYICVSCKTDSEEEGLTLFSGFTYTLNPEKIDVISNYTLDLNPLINFVQSKNWLPITPATLKGNSGVSHTFTFLAHPPYAPPREGVAIDVDISDEPVDQQRVLTLFSKALDVGVKNTALAVVGDVNESARSLAKAFGIMLFIGKTVEEVYNSLFSYLGDLIARKSKESLRVEAEYLESLIRSLERIS